MFRRPLFLLLIVLAILIPLVWFYIVRFEGTPPEVSWSELKYLGREATLRIDALDEASGLRDIKVTIEQRDKPVVLLEELYPSAGLLEGGDERSKTYEIPLTPIKLGIQDGEALLKVQVRDYSLAEWFHGNRTTLEQKIIVDTAVPMITVVSNTRYMNQGGSAAVLYRISKEVLEQGVMVNERLFHGLPLEGKVGLFLSMIALPYDTAEVQLKVVAKDRAGNRGEASFPYRIAGKNFSKDKITLSDSFLQRVISKFVSKYPELSSEASPLDVFVRVNTQMRKSNEDHFREVCSKSIAEKLWSGAFLALPNAGARAGFADYRDYLYQGRVVSHSYHLGLDLASLAQAPVPAANNGIVADASYSGIYGNTVIIDHGFGLFTTYSHLSNIAVTPGQSVKKGQVIGHTGTSGLAVGDHLHFGTAIYGIFVNPVEWLDAGWVEKKILDPLKPAFESPDSIS